MAKTPATGGRKPPTKAPAKGKAPKAKPTSATANLLERVRQLEKDKRQLRATLKKVQDAVTPSISSSKGKRWK